MNSATTAPIVITGATASGKTTLAIELAQKIDAEIICADSRTVYKGLDIVSAKPTEYEMRGIKHHLLDVVDVGCDFSAADFARLAQKAMDDIKKRGKNVIIAGGTWFYIKSCLNINLLPDVGADKALREKLSNLSVDEVWQILYELDPVRAKEVHKNNKDKVIRSIEMCKGLNMPVSKFRPQTEDSPCALWFAPDIERENLYERINARVDVMIDSGLYDEWSKNRNMWPNSRVLRNTIGYREFFELEEGVWKDFDEAVEKIKQHTRNFAKRQLTYFRNNNNITPIKDAQEVYEAVKKPLC